MKKVIIMQGIPGSGKSTEVKRLMVEYGLLGIDVLTFSADYHFERSGTYVFNAKELGAAHGQCLRGFTAALVSPRTPDNEVAIVDNTNTTVAEMNTYVKLCQAHDIPFEIRTVVCDPALAGARNAHGVPPEKVWAMHRRMTEAQIPKDWPHVIVSGYTPIP